MYVIPFWGVDTRRTLHAALGLEGQMVRAHIESRNPRVAEGTLLQSPERTEPFVFFSELFWWEIPTRAGCATECESHHCARGRGAVNGLERRAFSSAANGRKWERLPRLHAARHLLENVKMTLVNTRF